jgi:NAD(P)-dependent dehydrogenase (short-subunit alcohol dehydrogenase family)
MNVLEQFNLKGKNVLITGAGMGLGKAMAIALAEAGANIAIIDLNLENAQKTASEIQSLGVASLAVEANVAHYDSAENAVQVTLAQFKTIDILVNNAGIVRHVNAEDMPMKDWYDVIDVNLNAVFIMSQLVGRAMIKQKSGSIINISSMSGQIVNTPQNQCSYNASKAGVIQLTKTLACEWAPHNIRVNTIAPGYMQTELNKKFLEDATNKPLVDRWLSMTPMNRVGLPAELGGLVVYLASEASTFLNGSVYNADGGYTAW